MADTPKTVVTFDPERNALVDAPASDVKALEAAGYKTGPAAQEEMIYHEAPAKATAMMGGAANEMSLGLSDAVLEHLLPKDMLEVYHNSIRANPEKRKTGELLGLPGNLLMKGAATAAGGIPGLALAAGGEGAAEAFSEERRLGEPISVERLIQAAGLNALLNVGAEVGARGLVAALPAGAKALRALAKRLKGAGVPEFPDMPFGADGGVGGLFGEAPTAPRPSTLTNLAADEGVSSLPRPPEAFASPKSTVGTTGGLAGVNQGYADLAGVVAPRTANALRLAANPEAAGVAAERMAGAAERIAQVTRTPMNALSKVLKGLIFQGGREGAEHIGSIPLDDVDGEYAQKVQAVETAASAPEATAAHIREMFGPAFDHSEDTRTAFDTMVTQTLANAELLHDHMPRAPYDPALQGNDWNPPRSAKIDWLRKYHHVNDPSQALANPTPANMAILEQTHPATVKYARDVLLSMLQDPKTFPGGKRALTTDQARKLSIILGTPVRPQTAGPYIGRLQKSAVPDAPQSAKPNAAPSAKTANQVMIMTATPMQQHELGQ